MFLRNLDDASQTREMMIAEMERDIASDTLYVGKYLSETGKAAWPRLLRKALEFHDSEWLEDALSQGDYWLATYPRRNPSGGFTQAKVPVSAPAMLAEGEFVRFYLRGLSLRAMAGGTELRVVRVKEVKNPRPESEAAIGRLVAPRSLLADLRENKGIDTHLGIPAGPNSGLGAELV